MEKSFFRKCLIICIGNIAFVACSDNGTSAEEFNAASLCPETERGTFIDERDGQVYKYTTIGNQVWMAENLRYVVTDETKKNPVTGEQNNTSNKCYYHDNNCEEKGYSYNWIAAYYACPNGWHLPNIDEWNALIDRLGGYENAGFRLKSSSGWVVLNPGDDANWRNECGFSALPTLSSGEEQDGVYATWWLSDYRPDSYVSGNYNAWVLEFDGYTHFITLEYAPPNYDGLFSVRCLKN